MSTFKIFHNPRCSKSRQALRILQDNNCEIEIFNYLEKDLDVSLIKDILKKLSLKPRDILRTSELDYKDNNLKEDDLSDDDLIDYMIKYPKLIELYKHYFGIEPDGLHNSMIDVLVTLIYYSNITYSYDL